MQQYAKYIEIVLLTRRQSSTQNTWERLAFSMPNLEFNSSCRIIKFTLLFEIPEFVTATPWYAVFATFLFYRGTRVSHWVCMSVLLNIRELSMWHWRATRPALQKCINTDLSYIIFWISCLHLTETDRFLCVIMWLVQHLDIVYDIGVVFSQLDQCDQSRPYQQCLQIRTQQEWVQVVL